MALGMFDNRPVHYWNVSTTVGSTGMKIWCRWFMVPKRMNPVALMILWPFTLVYPTGQSLYLLCEISQLLLEKSRKYIYCYFDPLSLSLVPPWGSHLLSWVKFLDNFFDGLSWNFLQTFDFPPGFILITFVSDIKSKFWFISHLFHTFLTNLLTFPSVQCC